MLTFRMEKRGFDGNVFGEIFDSEAEEEVPEVGFNWMAVVWGVVLIGSVAGFLYNQYRTTIDRQHLATFLNTALEVESNTKDITNQSILAFGGNEEAFPQLQGLVRNIDSDIAILGAR